MDFGNNIKSIEKTIVKYLRGKEEILFAYIFGSLARKTSNRLSDIDIAIYIDDKKIDNSKFRYGYKDQWPIFYGLQISIHIVIDIGNHILAELKESRIVE